MKQAYTPALEVNPRTRISKVRELPLPGESLVSVGDAVEADTPVLSAKLPGDLTIVRAADRMGFEPDDVVEHLRYKAGDEVQQGDLLCEIKTFFGLFTTRLHAPASGVIEFFTAKNAHLGIRHESIPLSVDAYIRGSVTEVEEGKRVTIETEGALIQGIFGVGGERHGVIRRLDCPNDEVVPPEAVSLLGESVQGAVLLGGAQFSIEALREAGERGAAAIVTGSIDADALAQYVGHEIGVSITGDEDVPSTLIVTEGFGMLPISKRVTDLAESLAGLHASVNGATQVRAGATRPEVIVPLETAGDRWSEPLIKTLEVGAAVRIIRVPYFGLFGTVTEMPSRPCRIESGAVVRVLKARLDSGDEVIVPRANVELL